MTASSARTQATTPRAKRGRRTLVWLLVTVPTMGILLLLTTPGRALEQRFALAWLFSARGPVAAPPDVVIVDIDRESAARLGEPMRPRLWDRRHHGRLVDALVTGGARAIAFDLVWPDAHEPDEDATFAASLARAGNVALVAELDRPAFANTAVITERLAPPASPFGSRAAAVVPWPLPQADARVDHFWAFKPSAGDLPTLAGVMLHLYASASSGNTAALDSLAPSLVDGHPRLAARIGAVLDRSDSDPVRAARDLRDAFLTHAVPMTALHASIDAHGSAHTAVLKALVALYNGSATRRFNLYGPPRTLEIVAYADFLCSAHETDCRPPNVRDKAVFVGVAAAHQPVLGDVFETAFSTAAGARLSGVELGATAFANLLHRSTLRAPPAALAIGVVVAVGIAAALLGWALPVLAVPLGMGALGAAVFTTHLYLFSEQALVLPTAVPLAGQLPFALLLALALRYLAARRERSAMRRALGLYLPSRVADSVGDSPLDLKQTLKALDERVFCVCLSTDAADFTASSEDLSPEAAQAAVNNYYEDLFTVVRRHGGIVSDVVGDAMLALWPAGDDGLAGNAGLTAAAREQACLASVDIRRAMDDARAQGRGFVTRTGLHCGEVLLGHVGAGEHYEYRAVGDVVNTSARLQALNKRFGTRTLLSAEVVHGLPTLLTRRIARVALRGKRERLVVHELLGARATAAERDIALLEAWRPVTAAFAAADGGATVKAADRLLKLFPSDGPALALREAAGRGGLDGVFHAAVS